MDAIHPVISGNKWMKLLPWLTQATNEGRTGIVTKGGPWSNHIHAAAYAARQNGLSMTAIIKARNEMNTGMLEDIRQWDATIIYADHEKWEDEGYWENYATNLNSLYIPMGGEGEKAVTGVSEYLDEIELTDAEFDYILCPVGTGTTLKGIAHSKLGYHTLIGISPGIHDPAYSDLLAALAKTFPNRTFLLQENMSLKKFGKWPDLLPGKMNEWYRLWQLPTDIVYTAKMFFIFEELLSAGFFPPGSRILLVHTGGLQGNRSLPSGTLIYE